MATKESSASVEVDRSRFASPDGIAHVLCVTSTLAFPTDGRAASRGRMPHPIALCAEDLPAISNMLVVWCLIGSSGPIECLVAQGVADTTLASGLEHRTVEHVSPGVVARFVVVSAVWTVESISRARIRDGSSSWRRGLGS